jgi:hypothetical protein
VSDAGFVSAETVRELFAGARQGYIIAGDGITVASRSEEGTYLRARSCDNCPPDEWSDLDNSGEVVFSNAGDVPDEIVTQMCLRHLCYCSGEWHFAEEDNPRNAGTTDDYINLVREHYDPSPDECVCFVFEFWGGYVLSTDGGITPGHTVNYGMTYFDLYVNHDV